MVQTMTKIDKPNLWQAASDRLGARLSAYPAIRAEKHPKTSWGEFQQRRMELSEVPTHFNGADAICIICGAVSENLTVLDFDDRGSCFEAWGQKVVGVNPTLMDSLVREKSPSDGDHIYVRSSICGTSEKLAKRIVPTDGPDEVTINGKQYKPKQDKASGQWYAEITLIETKAEGGLILCDPTPGYRVIQGSLLAIPEITPEQLRFLLDCARSFDETPKPVESKPKAEYRKVESTADDATPWGDFNSRGDVRAVLERSGWRKTRDSLPGDDNEHWTRPGKTAGTSATLNSERLFYVFSSNASPFDEGQAYNPFQVFMMLEHGGDQKAAGRALAELGYGKQLTKTTITDATAAVSPGETGGEWTPPEAIDDPHRLARLQIPKHSGKSALSWHREEWFEFCDYAYQRIGSNEIRARVTRGIKSEFDDQAFAMTRPDGKPIKARKVTSRVTNDTMRALESLTMLPGRIDQPAWLEDDSPPPWPANECVVTRSGIIHIGSVGTGTKCVIPCTPTLFTTNVLPYGWDATADCPEWLRFLGSLLADDPASIDTLQEWFGYCLIPDTTHHKLLMLIGPPRSGKGTIARVLRGMIGNQNLASPTLSSLAGPFGLWPLVGKLVALIADARLSGRVDAVAVVERLLSISGEDPQDVARKNLPTLAGVRLPVRFMIMTNELPNMRDASGALLTRVILLKLTKSFTGREDRKLGDRLLRELPGVLNWSIRGLQRLQARGYLVQPESGRELLDDLKDMASPISAFIEDRCHLGTQYSVAIDDLFGAWQTWCESHGRDHPGSQQTFGRDLRAARPEITVCQRRTSLSSRARFYEGIGLQPELT
jgi:putative DNA primase/helicase